MKVSSVPDRCCGSGVCVEIAPEVFDLDDDGFVQVLAEAPAPEHESATRDAATRCPTMAIVVDD
ncbi:ferredoxin [Pseudonocardia acidicola]|uniref:Ferredoxin n=1 Tax=Pseudonocardia acidicola TaxID=2724939 RepID=A0ABX1SD66_9PSEU|nr:ferredoxin [Pseudonocardia acidicola]NMH98209.1 ferredoxin [Pseudonocardia acidicola]